MSDAPKILIIATSAAAFGPSGAPTGLWLEELTTPYYLFRDAGAAVTLASIAGGAIPIDPRSVKAAGANDASVERGVQDPRLQAELAATPCFSGLNWREFDGVLLPGGHGTMIDYPESAALAQLIADYDAAGKVIAALCHGPAGLVGARRADGAPVVAGRRLTAFTDSEERAVGLEHDVPFLLESRLKALGARHEAGPNFQPFALRDGNLVTGQNPASATLTARLTLEALAATE